MVKRYVKKKEKEKKNNFSLIYNILFFKKWDKMFPLWLRSESTS